MEFKEKIVGMVPVREWRFISRIFSRIPNAEELPTTTNTLIITISIIAYCFAPHDFPHHSGAHISSCDWYCLASTLYFKSSRKLSVHHNCFISEQKHQDSEGEEMKWKHTSFLLTFSAWICRSACLPLCIQILWACLYVPLHTHVCVFWLLNTCSKAL